MDTSVKSKKKILIIDDSALMRRVMSDIIKSDHGLCVEDEATNGQEGISYLAHGKVYDLILLDINMPKMDGLAFMKKLVEMENRTKVLVVSSIASKSTKETIQALELGAFDFVKKPENYIGSTTNEFKEQLLCKVNVALGNEQLVDKNLNFDKLQVSKKQIKPTRTLVFPKGKQSSEGKMVFIATSTGGPKTLQQVIPYFPASFPYPIVVIQHMPEGFTNSLAERLNQMSKIQVRETEDGEVLQKGVAYIVKGGHQCYILQKSSREHVFAITKDEPRHGLRPCADVTLESLADTGYEEIICTVLTGMGDDATRGLAYLQQYKTISVFAQDRESSVVYGMPRAVKHAGLVAEETALQSISSAIIKKAGE